MFYESSDDNSPKIIGGEFLSCNRLSYELCTSYNFSFNDVDILRFVGILAIMTEIHFSRHILPLLNLKLES